MNLKELYTLLEQKGIATHTIDCPLSKAISLNFNGTKFIGMDPSVLKNEYDERLVLAHEVGHALTDAYYTKRDNPVFVARMENRANKKTVEMLVPKNKLDAVLDEHSTVYDLSQYFSVPEEIIKKAFWLYYKKQIP